MDFIEFLKGCVDGSEVRIEVRDNKIYRYLSSADTGFSLRSLNEYDLLVYYLGSSTGYELQRDFYDRYLIYKDGSSTGYEICGNGVGTLTLFRGGSLYGEGDFLRECEEENSSESTLSSSSSIGESDSFKPFEAGFWDWGSWGKGWIYILGATFSAIGVVAAIVSPYILLVGPGFMAFWAMLIIIHNARGNKMRRGVQKNRAVKSKTKKSNKSKKSKKHKHGILITIGVIVFSIVFVFGGYIGYYSLFGGGLEAIPIYQWITAFME